MDGFMLLAGLGMLYGLPSVVAGLRRHNSGLAIFMLNMLLGWTVLGWIIALVWSCTGNTTSNRD